MNAADLLPRTAMAVFPLLVAAFMAYSANEYQTKSAKGRANRPPPLFLPI
jgi:hypothetical protein